jgi:peptidoglycan/LPS O-acetylase OafA/YrhL
MIHKLRPVLSLLIIYILLLSGGLLVLNSTSPELSSTTYATLLTIMTLITLGAYLLVITGTRKGDKDQGIWLLAGLGGKFLAYLVLVLIFWAVGKNLTKDFIIAFFVLYLLLTIFLLSILFKALKNN